MSTTTYAGQQCNLEQWGFPYVDENGQVQLWTTDHLAWFGQAGYDITEPIHNDTPQYQDAYQYLMLVALWADAVGGIYNSVPTSPELGQLAGQINFG